MGKTTLYHPVSLHVIRGAAEYCGWKFGKIKQISNTLSDGTARYTAEIKAVPQRLTDGDLKLMYFDLRECFAKDIEVHWLRRTKSGSLIVDIVTRAIADGEIDVSIIRPE